MTRVETQAADRPTPRSSSKCWNKASLSELTDRNYTQSSNAKFNTIEMTQEIRRRLEMQQHRKITKEERMKIILLF